MGAVKSAARVLPVLSSVSTAIDIFDGITGYSDRKKLQELRRSQQLTHEQMLRSLALERQMQAEESRQAEEKRLETLRRSVASQRAKFGAQGVGAAGGSAEAVLLGLFEESEEERMERERVEALKDRALTLKYDNQKALNLLEATQAAEAAKRQRYYFLP